MATTISFSIQKGGSGKTTTAGITTYLLSEMGYKVLAVDMDSQGNLTEMLFRGQINSIYDFEGRTVLEAILRLNAERFIHKVNDKIHMLTAEDNLAMLPTFMQTQLTGSPVYALDSILGTVQNDYDYIIIDTPPALGEQTVMSFLASDYIVAMFETSPFCYSALPRFLGNVDILKRNGGRMEVVGILRTMLDARRKDSQDFAKLVEMDYPDLSFDTIIKRVAATGRLPIDGFYSNSLSEIKKATDQYIPFVEELLQRVEQRRQEVHHA